MKEPFTKNLIILINKISLPDIPIPEGNGNANQIKLTLYDNTEPIKFEAEDTMNALSFKLDNIKGNIRVNDFYYEVIGFIPIKGYLDITMSNV
jgi:hypothetical protein